MIAAPENYHNLKLFFDKCYLNELEDATHINDRMMNNIIVGKQNHK